MLKGTYVGLRALEFSDLPQLQLWRNNAAMRRYYREYRELNLCDQERWFNDICCGNRNFCMFGIVLLTRAPAERTDDALNVELGSLIGVCGLTNIHWVLRSAELSFYIGASDLYVDGTYAPEAAQLLCGYAFNSLNMHKIWAEIYEFDERKIALFEQMRMHRDGRLRDNSFENGAYHDSLVFSLLRSEFSHSR